MKKNRMIMKKKIISIMMTYDDGCHDFFDVDNILIRRRYVI